MINIRYEETTVTHTIKLIRSDNECFNIYAIVQHISLQKPVLIILLQGVYQKLL